ncbi:RIO1 family-domain-containing protein [Phellopilus nigrolimitatus]|nr:RIO1 family-domain-containing protein [Phellopilus nigrolimitatus]
MKLDASDLRYVTSEEFRVLTAVEMGSKNHEVVPSVLISKIAGLRSGGVNKLLGSLAKRNLIARVQNTKYDGYRLTYGGYDYLAMRALSKRDSMYSVGNQIGVGKESDVYAVADADGKQMVLKLHRLGRVSFRAIKEKRDYMGKRKSASWMYMSRLAAQKEWAFMKVLHEHGFPVPTPIDQARHCIVMELIDSFPLRQITEVASPGKLYSQLMDLIVRFAHAGLIHGDFNEFNILIRRTTGEPIVIDFPQMVSTSHENAEWYFNRDVECIRRFFRRRFRYESVLYPRFKTVMKEGEDKGEGFQLDVVVSASGFGKKEMKTLEEYMKSVREEQQSDEEEGGEDEEMVEDSDESEDEQHRGGNEEMEDGAEGSSVSEHGETAARSAGTGARRDLLADADETDDSGAHSDTSSAASRRSRAPSPTDSLIAYTASLTLSPPALPDADVDDADGLDPGLETVTRSGDSHPEANSIKERVASDISRHRARQTSKYHSKRGAKKIGRPKGSKAKQDLRVKVDQSGVWE